MIQDPDVMNTQSCDLNNGKKKKKIPNQKLKKLLSVSLSCVCVHARVHIHKVYTEIYLK